MATTTQPRGLIATLALVLLVIIGAVGTTWWRQSVPPPSVELGRAIVEIGARPSFPLIVEAARGRVDEVSVRLLQGDVDATVFSSRPGEPSATLDVAFELAGRGLREGEALLEVHATDDFWRIGGAGDEPALRVPVLIDLTAPRLQIRGATRYPAAGGAAVAVLASEGAEEVWVEVGDRRFASHPKMAGESELDLVLYALGIDHPASDTPVARARDAAGNLASVPLPVILRDPQVPTGEVNLSPDWLERKLPELLPGRILEEEDLTEAFLEVSRDQRAEAAALRDELARASVDERLWSGAFLQMPNSRTMSRFGVRRTYRIEGVDLDTQVHQGFDFASVAQAPVPAANAGRVVFAGPLFLYGNTVILDHGWGLLTLYGHCSSLEVAVGDTVERGAILARTGATGLAAGDHLHFEVIVGGQPVTPIQWFDGNWIRDHVLAPVRDAGIDL